MTPTSFTLEERRIEAALAAFLESTRMGAIQTYLALRMSALKSAELDDLATAAWSLAPTMQFTRIHPTSTLLPNGQVLVVGDEETNGGLAELFDPVTSRWLPVPRRARFAPGRWRFRCAMATYWWRAASASPGPRYMTGGANGWRRAGTLKVTLVSAAGTALGSGLVLVAGGFESHQLSYASVELYDPSGKPAATVIPRAAAPSVGF